MLAHAGGFVPLRVLQRRPPELRARAGATPRLRGLERHMVLDVDGSISATARGDQEVGLADSPSGRVARQASPEDEREPRRDRRGCCDLQRVGVGAFHGDRVRMKLAKVGDDLGLEQTPSLEAAFEYGRGRDRFSGTERVVLGSYGTLLGDVTTLEWHRRNVVSRRHTWPSGEATGARRTPWALRREVFRSG